MEGFSEFVWCIPVIPLLAALALTFVPASARRVSLVLGIGSMGLALVGSIVALIPTLQQTGEAGVWRATHQWTWMHLGSEAIELGWVLDPLSAVMLVMVCFVGILIFIFSAGYMAADANIGRFYCFLTLFAAAMLGLVIANSLLLLFICWELVGLASYLLIGFWYHKPEAAAAAKKAFITTRLGDLGLFIGMLWLYAETGTLLFYDNGAGCLEGSALSAVSGGVTGAGIAGVAVSTAISLLLFCGAVGKSGQVPLHVWLPDAMEGPTPVSALIHAATMVAAGVFLVARVYPLMDAEPGTVSGQSFALGTVVWVGSITALFAAFLAVAQTDIKRILAYSTVSQLGFMMMGLGAGGVAVGMFHLITHAFFKALLFLGAGSVIHGCHEEQDIRRMGGLRRRMPLTFAAYGVGMMALAGVPFLFSGFWSKDEILHAVHEWEPSALPFFLGIAAAFLTAFYMTRQMAYVFFGDFRGGKDAPIPHESSRIMTGPLVILAAFSVGLGFIGTPVWPWFQGFLTGEAAPVDFGLLTAPGTLMVLVISILIAGSGIGVGWWIYGRGALLKPDPVDPLDAWQPTVFGFLRHRGYVDELYACSVARLLGGWGWFSDWLDRVFWEGVVRITEFAGLAGAWISRFLDETVINGGFSWVCRRLAGGGHWLAGLQRGQVQVYLRVLALALVGILLLFAWGFDL